MMHVFKRFHMVQNQITNIMARIEQKRFANERFMIAIAGPPGAGKTTLGQALVNELADTTIAHYVPMDGFHLDNDTLRGLGWFDRKGAPQTFDALGVVAAVSDLRHNQETVSLPAFDRAKDISIPDVIRIPPAPDCVVVEGNYLLLTDAPWKQLASQFDLTIFLSPSKDILRERLIQRWLDHGMTFAAAHARAAGNDIPNAQFILDHSMHADMFFQ